VVVVAILRPRRRTALPVVAVSLSSECRHERE
jgi:hypothetical protein